MPTVSVRLPEEEKAHLDEQDLTFDAERAIECALASDGRRLRAVAEGLGATVTGTLGLVVGASVSDKYFSTARAKRVVRRTDHHGLQMTGRLRERAVGEVDS